MTVRFGFAERPALPPVLAAHAAEFPTDLAPVRQCCRSLAIVRRAGKVGFGASRAVPAAKAERRLWVPKRSAVADN
jgi:hypothetical protein